MNRGDLEDGRCDPLEIKETKQLLNTLFINIGVWIVLVGVFEFNRHMKSIYLKRRMKDKFVRAGRVPPEPGTGFLGWISTLNTISEDDMLQMVGLDGYMLMRYINICFHITLFISVWGACVLAPFYANSGGGHCAWTKYTLGNVPMGDENDVDGWSRLWAPALFAYIFSAYYCLIMYNEYHNFLEKRVSYLQKGDPDTPTQAYYTVMVEKIPASLRTAQALAQFFDNLFPGEVYSVQLAADLQLLDTLVSSRRNTRDGLEKAIAIWEASNQTFRKTVWIHHDDLMSISNSLHRNMLIARRKQSVIAPTTVLTNSTGASATTAKLEDIDSSKDSVSALADLVTRYLLDPTAECAGFHVVDAIDYYALLLQELNERVRKTQQRFLDEETHIVLPVRQPGMRADAIEPTGLYESSIPSGLTPGPSRSGAYQILSHLDDGIAPTPARDRLHQHIDMMATPGRPPARAAHSTTRAHMYQGDPYSSRQETPNRHGAGASNVAAGNRASAQGQLSESAIRDMRDAAALVQASAYKSKATERASTQSISSDDVAAAAEHGIEKAAKMALRGVLEATRTLELLTMGAYYKTSSTAFVTLSTRMASSSCSQMLLSHRHFTMNVRAAPNPKDIVWGNVMIPQRQIDVRRTIADITLCIGAFLWSLVVGFITQIANVETISKEYDWVHTYSGTLAYQLFNSYLSSSILLGLLAALPFMFNVIARSYEGLKLKSEIQNSIMTRYFYYQLANVFVSVYAGSIVSALQEIVDSPTSIFHILGSTIPNFSVYFVNLIIVKTFTAVPIEMLRIWPLIQILSLKSCMNKKTCTWRELRTGAFADPRVIYGWIYPSLMMVLMIVITYACISPLMAPLGVLYYISAYYMYKYQLLYVFINEYQSGGFMWYAVFTRSMIALICAVTTVVCYLGFRRSFNYGPFYFTLPLPILIFLFKNACEQKFVSSSSSLSLESAIELDRATYAKRMNGFPADSTFRPKLFRQPSLADGPLRPGPYRPTVAAPVSVDTPNMRRPSYHEVNPPVNPVTPYPTAAPASTSLPHKSAENVARLAEKENRSDDASVFSKLWGKLFGGNAAAAAKKDGLDTSHRAERAVLLTSQSPRQSPYSSAYQYSPVIGAAGDARNGSSRNNGGAGYGSTDAGGVMSPLEWEQGNWHLHGKRNGRRRSGSSMSAGGSSRSRKPFVAFDTVSPPSALLSSQSLHVSTGASISDGDRKDPEMTEGDVAEEGFSPDLSRVTGRNRGAESSRYHSSSAQIADAAGNNEPNDTSDSGSQGTCHDEEEEDGMDDDGKEIELVTNDFNEVDLDAADMGEIADVSELLNFPTSPYTSPFKADTTQYSV